MAERTSAKRTGDQAIRVADALREKIVSGELKPGEALRQERLAVLFETSRMPVRDALRLLEAEGLVQMPPNYRRAAADLGANGFQVFWHVVLPLTLPGIMVGAFLTFVLCIGDYITPQILGGNNELALPQVIMLQLGRRADFPMAATLSIILMVVVTMAYIACARWLKMERT